MKRALCFCVCFLLAVSVPFKASAYSAKAITVIEASTATPILSNNANTRLPMASTTKIMTAIIVLETLPLSKIITIPKQACNVEGSSMYLVEGEKLSVLDLLYGLMLSSGNDAATALALSVCKTEAEFVSLMNQKAIALGLKDTNFQNPSGLPHDNHYTTANELAIITCYALKNPTFAKIVSTKTAYLPYKNQKNGRYLKNHNKMLWLYDNAVGVKTGFTKKAGRCLVSAATKNNITLVCVTLGAPDDWNDHITALDNAFSKVSYGVIAKSGQVSVKLKTPSGKIVICKNSTDVFAPIFDGAQITQKIKAPAFLYAPKAKDQTVGEVEFLINGKVVGKSKLVTTTELNQKLKKQTILNYIKGIFKCKN